MNNNVSAMKQAFTLVLLSLTLQAYASDPKPADVDLFCSGMLSRASGLINENLGQYRADAQNQFKQVSQHLNNNGLLLMQRGMLNGGDGENLNLGMSFANRKIGSNIAALVQKGSDQNEAIMGCLRRSQ
jgi:hypothetical protein